MPRHRSTVMRPRVWGWRVARARQVVATLIALGAPVWVGCGLRSSHESGRGDQPGAATVITVVDGDTLEVEVGGETARVRLIGVDTPESVATDRPNECFGREASERLAALVPAGTPLRLERDLEARDRYQRLLAYVYRASDELFVNRDLVAGGFAEAMPYPPNTARQTDFRTAQVAARRAKAGLWGACGHADVPLDTSP
jgi:micrococcal nuclease